MSQNNPAPARLRADIQGLRALAVLAVILNHLIGWPTGGFVGVDIFFVISGFLITGMLLRDGDDGPVRLGRFYARRVRRILPAAVTVVAVTVIAGHFLFNAVREWSTLWDAVYALLFTANWHFAVLGTDYFHALGSVSPLQHYWSLSVEEQFYLVWPALIAILIAIVASAAGRRGTGLVVVGIVATALVALSFWYAVTQTAQSPAYTYFDTLARAWELGVGAVLAAAAPVLARIPIAVRFILGWAGLLVLLWSVVRITDSLAFPGPWAAAPVIGAALVIAGGIGGPQRYLFPLSNPVTTYLGTISYSLYLWHFPIIAFLLVLIPTQTPLTIGIIFAIIIGISVVAYYLVEQPFHRSPLFETGGREHRQAAWLAWRERFGGQFIGSALGLGAILAVIVVFSGTTLHGESPIAVDQDPRAASTELQADLKAAVDASTWPQDLSPSLDAVMTTTTLDNAARGCFDIGATPDFGACTWGLSSAPKHMYLVGDSTALAYAPAFKAIAEASGGAWKITTVGLYGCRFADVLVQSDDPRSQDDCTARKADVAKQIVADKPDLIVVSNDFAEATAADGSAVNSTAMVDATVAEMAKYDARGRIVYLAPPPMGADLGQCYSPVSSPQSCTVDVDPTWTDFANETKASLAKGDHFVSSLPFSCFDGRCPPFAGTLPTKYDPVHMTVAYATHVAPAIRSELDDLGLM